MADQLYFPGMFPEIPEEKEEGRPVTEEEADALWRDSPPLEDKNEPLPMLRKVKEADATCGKLKIIELIDELKLRVGKWEYRREKHGHGPDEITDAERRFIVGEIVKAELDVAGSAARNHAHMSPAVADTYMEEIRVLLERLGVQKEDKLFQDAMRSARAKFIARRRSEAQRRRFHHR